MYLRIWFHFFILLIVNSGFSQTEPILRIDTSRIVLKPGLSFPYWLNAGQTIKKEAVIKSISVIEFNLDSLGNLRFVKPMSITSNDEIIVPDGKVWKMESIGIRETLEYGKEGITSQTTRDFSNGTKPSIFTSPATFTTPGSFTWTVPPDVNRICVEIWGAGGKSGDIILSGHPKPGNYVYVRSGSGGGGGYGYQCFDVKPNTQYEVKIGNSSEDTYLGELIKAPSAPDGKPGYVSDTEIVNGENGVGGNTTAYFNVQGQNSSSDRGGNGANNGGTGSYNDGYNFQNYSYYDNNLGYVVSGGEISYPNPNSNYFSQSPGGGCSGMNFRFVNNFFSRSGNQITIKNYFGCSNGKIIIYW